LVKQQELIPEDNRGDDVCWCRVLHLHRSVDLCSVVTRGIGLWQCYNRPIW